MQIKAFDSSSGSRYHHTLSPLQVEGSGGADAEGVFGPISPQSGGASPSSASPSGRKQVRCPAAAHEANATLETLLPSCVSALPLDTAAAP